jgi:hypothetical protein
MFLTLQKYSVTVASLFIPFFCRCPKIRRWQDKSSVSAKTNMTALIHIWVKVLFEAFYRIFEALAMRNGGLSCGELRGS